MKQQSVYSPKDVQSPAYHLRYTGCGWPSSSTFPNVPSKDLFSQKPIWQSSYYAGTFGEYDMDAVRNSQTLALAGQAGKGPAVDMSQV